MKESDYVIYETTVKDEGKNSCRKMILVDVGIETHAFISSSVIGEQAYIKIADGELNKCYEFFDNGDFKYYSASTFEAKAAVLDFIRTPIRKEKAASLELASKLNQAIGICKR